MKLFLIFLLASTPVFAAPISCKPDPQSPVEKAVSITGEIQLGGTVSDGHLVETQILSGNLLYKTYLPERSYSFKVKRGTVSTFGFDPSTYVVFLENSSDEIYSRSEFSSAPGSNKIAFLVNGKIYHCSLGR